MDDQDVKHQAANIKELASFIRRAAKKLEQDHDGRSARRLLDHVHSLIPGIIMRIDDEEKV